MTQSFSLIVNGEEQRVETLAEMPLIYALRNHLNLRGTRYGCGLEQCGSCMVLIDGAPAYSCSRSIETAAGHKIMTVEGLADGTSLHPPAAGVS